MGIILSFITYVLVIIACLKGISNIMILCGRRDLKNDLSITKKKLTGGVFLQGLFDILFMGRLFRVNKLLWIGEWTFHVSFILTLTGHLRYILYPVPKWAVVMNCIGKYAGILLPLSLLFVLFVRLSLSERSDYVSPRNFFLILLILILGTTGVIMRFFIRPDIVGIKNYIMDLLTFNPGDLPSGSLFVIHYSLFLVLLLYLPTHILTAPFIIFESRKRTSTTKIIEYDE
ncbi:hypothetical protein BMS3Bbin06_00811 [bacterium BMS3Bbin06]|nr:hypothetical protein BMS3Abin08_00185 [bacterium BMS3Abin08]GBE34289.1 hypothetical protein BMS3Bbin06_00811 [bacterium BMS3Bbin06]HDO36616.1 hypothetical protein [Nitrospirota bacterium]HDY71395.1 hypothetical protein [Nitrospirota bacterium]